MKKNLKKIISNWKWLFCWSFICLGILLLIIVLIRQPMKKVITGLYSVEEVKKEEVNFPIKQKIKIDTDYLTGLWLYLDDYSLNNYNYKIELTDKEGKTYFKNNFNNYGSNIIYMGLGVIEDSLGMEFDLVITCDNCEDVFMATSLDENGGRVLKLVKENYVRNNIYYWHSIMAIAIGVVLLPIAKEEKKK